jgi:glucuronosyltransferase
MRTIMHDQPQTSLERAIWWTEYVLRHGGAKHLRSPAANVSWVEYLELELVLYLLASVVSVIVVLMLFICKIYKMFNRSNLKLKSN